MTYSRTRRSAGRRARHDSEDDEVAAVGAVGGDEANGEVQVVATPPPREAVAAAPTMVMTPAALGEFQRGMQQQNMQLLREMRAEQAADAARRALSKTRRGRTTPAWTVRWLAAAAPRPRAAAAASAAAAARSDRSRLGGRRRRPRATSAAAHIGCGTARRVPAATPAEVRMAAAKYGRVPY